MTNDFFQNLPKISENNWDWNIALKVLQHSKLVYLPKVVYLYRQHPNQLTKQVNYREKLFSSVSKQWQESFKQQFKIEISENVIRTIGFPYLQIEASMKDVYQYTTAVIKLQKVFQTSPVWAAYHFTVRLSILTTKLIQRNKLRNES